MALATYTDLVASIANWLDREDLSATIPDFVALAESRLNKMLRTMEMEATATAAMTSGSVALPADFLEARRIYTTAAGADGTALRLLSPIQAGDVYPTSRAGPPINYTLSDGTLYTYPNGGSGQVYMVYYASLPSLLSYGTNWLLTKAPDCYLYGSLMEASPFTLDDQRTETWAALFQRGVENVQSSDQRSRFSTSVCRVPGVNP